MLDKVVTHDHQKLNDFWQWLRKDTNLNPDEVSENGFIFL